MSNKKKKNKQKKKTSRQTEALEIMHRIETSLSAANALENPTKGLEGFCSMELPSHPKNNKEKEEHDNTGSSCGENGKDHKKEEGMLDNDQHQEFVQIDFYKSPLPEDLHKSCLQLFEENMGDMYRASSWGLDMKEKSDEFHHDNARFLIATKKITSTSNQSSSSRGQTSGEQQQEQQRGDVLGFAHFRFDVNDDDRPTEEVLYVYEIQISSKARRCGLGRRLMAIMELIAMRSQMRKVMLTVFKSNHAALGFYLSKMKYGIDESSPSQFVDNVEGGGDEGAADYEILSKQIKKMVK